jgi:hypothetical protein
VTGAGVRIPATICPSQGPATPCDKGASFPRVSLALLTLQGVSAGVPKTREVDRSWTSQLENVVMLCPGNEYVHVPFDTVTLANWARFWLAEVLNGVSELTVVP